MLDAQLQPPSPVPVTPSRSLLGLPWFATVALAVAGTLLMLIVFMFGRQLSITREMVNYTSRIDATAANTDVIAKNFVGLDHNIAALPDLNKASARFFSTAGGNLGRTAAALPAVGSSLAGLQATATPAFRQLSSGALADLPAIAAGIRNLEALDRLPQALDGNLAAVRAQLAQLNGAMGGIHGGLGAIDQSLGALASLKQVEQDTASLPSVVAALETVSSTLSQLNAVLGDIDHHVADVDADTAVLGLTRH